MGLRLMLCRRVQNSCCNNKVGCVLVYVYVNVCIIFLIIPYVPHVQMYSHTQLHYFTEMLFFFFFFWRRRRNGIRSLPSTIPDNSIDQTHQVCVCVAIDQIHQQQSQFTASTLSSFQAFRSRRSNTAQQQPSLHHRISPNEGTESVP